MSLCLVHLVWAPAGAAPLDAFVDTYERHPAGVDHELVLVCNGFDGREDAHAAVARAAPHAAAIIVLDVPVVDIAAYAAAAQAVGHELLCCVNSYGRILADGWLAKLVGPVRDGDSALAGSSASYASLLSLAAFQAGLPSAYGRILRPLERPAEGLRELELQQAAASPGGHRGAGMRRLAHVRSLRRLMVGFSRFPAHHIRTNAFAVRRDLFLHAGSGRVRDKVDAWRFESGSRSLTRAATRAGRPPLVVGADGEVYPPEQWPHSATFWQDDQENLLVADNQTRLYDEGDVGRRELLARLAWGPEARPAPPRSVSARR